MKNSVLESPFLSDPQWVLDNKKRLQAVFDNALDAILMADDQMRFVDANPAACVLTGYSLEELLNLKVPDITPLANHGLLATIWQQLLSAGKLEGEYQLPGNDGTTTTAKFRAVANIVSRTGERQLLI
jgi:PAS domain S-box-containing protein